MDDSDAAAVQLFRHDEDFALVPLEHAGDVLDPLFVGDRDQVRREAVAIEGFQTWEYLDQIVEFKDIPPALVPDLRLARLNTGDFPALLVLADLHDFS